MRIDLPDLLYSDYDLTVQIQSKNILFCIQTNVQDPFLIFAFLLILVITAILVVLAILMILVILAILVTDRIDIVVFTGVQLFR